MRPAISPRGIREPQREDATDAILDGDIYFRPGTAQAALRHRDFRVVWAGTFASNIGTWMQNVLLGAYGYSLTKSATFVAILFFAQLGPLLFLSTIGGVLADSVDRRKLIVWTQLEQLVLSVVLALLATQSHPGKTAIVGCVLAIGVGNALSAPAISAVLPRLVPRRDLPGAVSLQSVQMNLSRVIGPAIGAVIYSQLGAPTVFGINAATYLFAVAGVLAARFPELPDEDATAPGSRLLSGFRIAARDPLVRRILTTLATLSFFSLTFIGLMPALAARDFGIDPKSFQYGLLYAIFGMGATIGAVAIGTVLAPRSKPRIVRGGLVAFAALLAAFGSLRVSSLAYPVAAALGFAYFAVITSLSTILQEHLDDVIRGRVMALWIMAFGGTVPLGTLAAGPIAEATSISAVVVGGAAVALGLAWYARL
jgi:MFS family permease